TTEQLHKRVTQNLQRRNAELEALRAVDKEIIASAHTHNIQPVLELILERSMQIIGAPAGDIMWFNQWDNVLELKATRGFPEDRCISKQNIGEGVVGLAAQYRKPILVSDVTSQEWMQVYQAVIPTTRSELAVPLMDDNGLLGVLNLEHHEP